MRASPLLLLVVEVLVIALLDPERELLLVGVDKVCALLLAFVVLLLYTVINLANEPGACGYNKETSNKT